MFGLSLDRHVLPYFVDYSRTGSDCALEQARLSLCCWQMRFISDKLAQFSSGSNTRMEQLEKDSPKVEPEYTELHVIRKNF